FMVLMSLICVLFDRPVVFKNYIDLSQIIMPYFMYLYYKTRGTKIGMTFIYLILPVIVFVSIITIVELMLNPFVSRAINTGGVGLNEDANINVGGYIFIYTALLFAAVVFYYFLKIKDQPIVKIIALGLFLLLFYLVLLSNFFTATVLLIASVVVFFFGSNKRHLKFIIPMVLFLLPTYKYVGSIAIDSVCVVLDENGKNYLRLKEIQRSLEGKEKVSEDVDTRKDVKAQSIETFLKFPLTGAIVDSSMDNDSFAPIGRHSNILDTFAIFGFVIGVLFVMLFAMPFMTIYRLSHTYEQKLFVITIGVLFFMLMYNNNATASMGFVAFFIFPFTFDYLTEKNCLRHKKVLRFRKKE
ncbi:MAG: hypothetical protein KBT06_06995, partial [Prevotellaceae bacterium]|nr:hypothetical protein [Candidatus Colivivens equi]